MDHRATGDDVTAHNLWELRSESLSERQIDRAKLLLRLQDGDGLRTTVALDAASDEFVLIPGAPAGPLADPLALSPTGTSVLILDERHPRSLVLHSLPTGEQMRFDASRHGDIDRAALSPSSHTMATLCYEDDDVFLAITDLATRSTSRLWSAAGWTTPSAISWSPGGRLIAATYFTPEEFSASVIVDVATGALVSYHEQMLAFSSSNGAWLGEHELVLLPEDPMEDPPPLVVLDVTTGQSRKISRSPDSAGGCHAVIGGRLVQTAAGRGIYSTELDGSDARPFLATTPPRSLLSIDCAPACGGLFGPGLRTPS